MERTDFRMTYIKFYPSDFFGDDLVAEMTGAEKGAHALLILRAAQSGRPIDPIRSLRALGLDEGLWAGVSRAWDDTGDGWVQRRVEREREDAMRRSESAREAGRASAERRARNARSTVVERSLSERSTVAQRALDSRSTTPSCTNHSHSHSHSHSQEEREGATPPSLAAPPPRAREERASEEKPKTPRSASRKPSESQVRALVGQYLALSTLEGFSDAVVEWSRALGHKKRWASPEALSRRLAWLEKDPARALEYVQIATEERWTDPSYAPEAIARREGKRSSATNPYLYQVPEHLRGASTPWD